MSDVLPEIKKKVNAFLVGEEGKISKKSLMKAGAFIGALSIGSTALTNTAYAQYTHSNNLSAGFDTTSFTLTGSHTHHGSHSSHSSHSVHGSHGSGGWC
jgi:hypothetical protein